MARNSDLLTYFVQCNCSAYAEKNAPTIRNPMGFVIRLTGSNEYILRIGTMQKH